MTSISTSTISTIASDKASVVSSATIVTTVIPVTSTSLCPVTLTSTSGSSIIIKTTSSLTTITSLSTSVCTACTLTGPSSLSTSSLSSAGLTNDTPALPPSNTNSGTVLPTGIISSNTVLPTGAGISGSSVSSSTMSRTVMSTPVFTSPSYTTITYYTSSAIQTTLVTTPCYGCEKQVIATEMTTKIPMTTVMPVYNPTASRSGNGTAGPTTSISTISQQTTSTVTVQAGKHNTTGTGAVNLSSSSLKPYTGSATSLSSGPSAVVGFLIALAIAFFTFV